MKKEQHGTVEQLETELQEKDIDIRSLSRQNKKFEEQLGEVRSDLTDSKMMLTDAEVKLNAANTELKRTKEMLKAEQQMRKELQRNERDLLQQNQQNERAADHFKSQYEKIAADDVDMKTSQMLQDQAMEGSAAPGLPAYMQTQPRPPGPGKSLIDNLPPATLILDGSVASSSMSESSSSSEE
eukprot:UN34518